LIYAMGVSLDGFIAGPAGEIDWSAPDQELHQFHNDQMRTVGAHLCGRRLYETMVYWETADPDSAVEQEFAGIWQRLPKIVYSRTLEAVTGNARLERAVVPEEVERLKQEGDVAVGGAGLAATLTDLIDEFQVFVSPVVLGGGTPFFPAARIELELLETRTFASRVVYLRYGR
jgi:dihydrofolate reductase